MNIHAQARLLVKYELVTPNSLRDGAIQKSISPGCSYGRDFPTSADEPQILTQLLRGFDPGTTQSPIFEPDRLHMIL